MTSLLLGWMVCLKPKKKASGEKLFQSVRSPLGRETLSRRQSECLWWISCHCHPAGRWPAAPPNLHLVTQKFLSLNNGGQLQEKAAEEEVVTTSLLVSVFPTLIFIWAPTHCVHSKQKSFQHSCLDGLSLVCNQTAAETPSLKQLRCMWMCMWVCESYHCPAPYPRFMSDDSAGHNLHSVPPFSRKWWVLYIKKCKVKTWRVACWIVMKCGSDIHVPLRLNCNDFGDPLTFHLVPSSLVTVSMLAR